MPQKLESPFNSLFKLKLAGFRVAFALFSVFPISFGGQSIEGLAGDNQIQSRLVSLRIAFRAQELGIGRF